MIPHLKELLVAVCKAYVKLLSSAWTCQCNMTSHVRKHVKVLRNDCGGLWKQTKDCLELFIPSMCHEVELAPVLMLYSVTFIDRTQL